MFLFRIGRLWIVLALITHCYFSYVCCFFRQNNLTDSNNRSENYYKSHKSLSSGSQKRLKDKNIAHNSEDHIPGVNKGSGPGKQSPSKPHVLLVEEFSDPYKVKVKKSHRRQFLEPVGAQHHGFTTPLFHQQERIQFVPKPFPVLAIKYVPRPVPVPVQPPVHVSHVYPHCE